MGKAFIELSWVLLTDTELQPTESTVWESRSCTVRGSLTEALKRFLDCLSDEVSQLHKVPNFRVKVLFLFIRPKRLEERDEVVN